MLGKKCARHQAKWKEFDVEFQTKENGLLERV